MQFLIDQFSAKRDKVFLNNLAYFKAMTMESLSNLKLCKQWCSEFTDFINESTPVNLKYLFAPSDEVNDDKTYSVLIKKTLNGVVSDLEPLNKHFFSSDSYGELVLMNFSKYNSSIWILSLIHI